MPAEAPDTLARASESIGSQASSGIGLRTKPLPWQTVSTGSVLEFLRPALSAAWKRSFRHVKMTPRPCLTMIPRFCVLVLSKKSYSWAARVKVILVSQLTCFEAILSLALSSCSCDYPSNSGVEFHSGAEGCLMLHFFGDENPLCQCASSLRS